MALHATEGVESFDNPHLETEIAHGAKDSQMISSHLQEVSNTSAPPVQAAQSAAVPSSPSFSSSSCQSVLGDAQETEDPLHTRPTDWGSEKPTGLGYARQRSSLASTASNLSKLVNDDFLDALADRLCSRLNGVLECTLREAMDSGMAPLEQAIEEIRVLSCKLPFASADERTQHKQQGQSESTRSVSRSQGRQLRLPTPALVRPAEQMTACSARSEGNSNAAPSEANARNKGPSDDCWNSEGKSEQQGSFLSHASETSGCFVNIPANTVVSPRSRRRIQRRTVRSNSSKVADAESDITCNVVPSETVCQQKRLHHAGGDECTPTAGSTKGGRLPSRKPSRGTFCDRGSSFGEDRSVQSLLLDVANMTLQDRSLIERRGRFSRCRDSRTCIAVEGPVVGTHDDFHLDAAEAPQESERQKSEQHTSSHPSEERHASELSDKDLVSDRVTQDSESDPSSAHSGLSPLSPTSANQLRQSRVEELVHSAHVKFPSTGRYLRTDRRLCNVMKVCGVLPWESIAEESEVRRCPGVWHQWFTLLLVFVACCVCGWTAWARFWVKSRQPDSLAVGFALAMDIPLTAGAFFGLVSLRAYSGSKELMECHTALRSHARESCFRRWMAHAQRDLVCSALVGSIATVVRFLGEGLSLHSVACAISSALLSSLTFSVVYVCRASSNLVDQYCTKVLRTTPTDQVIFDWNVVHALLSKASGALEKCVFVLLAAALVAIVLGVIDMVRGALRGFALYASFLSWALVTLDLVRIMFCAAAVTDRCMRVPSLISSCSNDMDPNRNFVVQHIVHARAGFYVFDILLDSALAIKVVYVTCAVGLVAATDFALNY